MQSLKLGVGFEGYQKATSVLKLAKDVERNNFHSVWVGEHYLWRDGVSVSAAICSLTKRTQVGICVLNPYTRNPALLAMTLATLDEIGGGRLMLGLGPSIAQWMEPIGVKFYKPAIAVREAVAAVRGMLEGKTVSYIGETLKFEGVRLQFEAPRNRIPIYIAAMSKNMLRLAGEVGDGVILTSCVPDDYVKHALEQVKIGAERVGRKIKEFEVVRCMTSAVDEDGNKARESAKSRVANFISLNLLAVPKLYGEFSDFDEKNVSAILNLFLKGDLKEAERLVTSDMMEQLAIAGDPKDFKRRVSKLASTGATLSILYFSTQADIRHSIELIGKIA